MSEETRKTTHADVPKVEACNIFLEKRSMSGAWTVPAIERPLEPRTEVQAHIWRWAEVFDSLIQARESISIETGGLDRRTIKLVNPGLKEKKLTTHTMNLAFQLIQPGELAPAHRHTMTAIRFILQGNGGYTNVEGQKMKMSEGDLILTPQWSWHEHVHEGDDPMIWIDGLDTPLIQSLQVISFEPNPEKAISTEQRVDSSSDRSTKPSFSSFDKGIAGPLHYRWSETYPLLNRLDQTDLNPYEGYILQYDKLFNKASASLTTLSCWIQLLRPGMRTQVHRHTSTSIYHAFRGSGTTIINGEQFDWNRGDTFVVPLWSWHEHANKSVQEDAILFSMHDAPVFKALGLYREQNQGQSYLGF